MLEHVRSLFAEHGPNNIPVKFKVLWVVRICYFKRVIIETIVKKYLMDFRKL